MGFFLPRRLRAGRWALTPPFHPCRPSRNSAASGGLIFCDTVRHPRLGPGTPASSTRHVALRCSDFPPGVRLGMPGDRLPSACSRGYSAHRWQTRGKCAFQGNRAWRSARYLATRFFAFPCETYSESVKYPRSSPIRLSGNGLKYWLHRRIHPIWRAIRHTALYFESSACKKSFTLKAVRPINATGLPRGRQ